MSKIKYHAVRITKKEEFKEIKEYLHFLQDDLEKPLLHETFPILVKVSLSIPFKMEVCDIDKPFEELKDCELYSGSLVAFFQSFTPLYQDLADNIFKNIIKRRDIGILCNFPHASTELPEWFFDGIELNSTQLLKANTIMSDIGIDSLFQKLKAKKLKPKYSRLFVDVERFKDNEKEPMSKVGQGVIYTHLWNGVRFRKEVSNEYRIRALQYYDDYHNKLNEFSKEILSKHKELLILDCHSFSDKIANQLGKGPFPDICLGLEDNYLDIEIIDALSHCIKSRWNTARVDYPYKGSIIPSKIASGEIKGKVTSIMIEVNKRLYL